MQTELEAWTDKFEQAWFVAIHNLGPQLINRMHLGLTPGQVFMLFFLRKEGPCSVSRLAEMLEVAPSAITVMLDRLEHQAYVARGRDQADRRIVIVQLTQEGEAQLQHVLAVRKEVIKNCLQQIDGKELAGFVTTLEKLARIASAMNTETTVQEE